MTEAYDEFAKREITLHLASTEKEVKKYCLYCRRFIFKSKHKVISILEEEASEYLPAPITVHCGDCKTLYNIQTII